jgi:hypothetical protein
MLESAHAAASTAFTEYLTLVVISESPFCSSLSPFSDLHQSDPVQRADFFRSHALVSCRDLGKLALL